MREYMKFYIDGQWVDPITPKSLDVINPATEAVAGHISVGTAADVDKAVKAARKAFATFSLTSRDERIALLERIIAEYQKRYGDMAAAITEEMGAPASLSMNAQAAIGMGHLQTAVAVLKNYKFFGHIHTKKSPHTSAEIANEWINFLTANLLSIDNLKTMDLILHFLQDNDKVGLVFPDDPTIVSWDKNYDIAKKLANRMGIDELPQHFNFPIGTMFWGRVKALEPLFDLNLGLDDFPDEPVPTDGTILHAIERLLPFVAAKAGYSYALFNSTLITR